MLLQLEQPNPIGFNFHGFHPEPFTQLGTGSGFAPRLRYYQPRLADSPFDLQASAQVSILKYQQHAIELGRIQSGGKRFSMPQKAYERLLFEGPGVPGDPTRFYLYGQVRYRNFPREDFYGLGSQSLEENRTTYTLEDLSYDDVGGVQKGRVAAGLRAGWLSTEARAGQDDRFPPTQAIFGETEAPGVTAGRVQFFRTEASFELDFRDEPGNPHRGGVVTISHLRFDERDDDAFDFTRTAVDARAFVPLGSPQRVLALRLYASSDEPRTGAAVPFFLQDYLGGSHSLRGFRRNRFIDENLLGLSAEYRWEALTFVEFTLFYEAGKAFPDDADFDLDGLRKSYGVGVRFKSKKAVHFRVDVAWGDEGTRLYLKFGPSY